MEQLIAAEKEPYSKGKKADQGCLAPSHNRFLYCTLSTFDAKSPVKSLSLFDSIRRL